MPSKIDECPVVDNAATSFADDGGLHPVVKDLVRDAANRFEGRHVAAQDGLHVLVQDKARPDHPAEAEHK